MQIAPQLGEGNVKRGSTSEVNIGVANELSPDSEAAKRSIKVKVIFKTFEISFFKRPPRLIFEFTDSIVYAKARVVIIRVEK